MTVLKPPANPHASQFDAGHVLVVAQTTYWTYRGQTDWLIHKNQTPEGLWATLDMEEQQRLLIATQVGLEQIDFRTSLNDERIDLSVLRRGYNFIPDQDGKLHGLVAGDMNYDDTGLQLDMEGWECRSDMDRFEEYIRAAYPRVEINRDVPKNADGWTHIDVTFLNENPHQPDSVITDVVYNPARKFGVYVFDGEEEPGYGEHPSVINQSPAEAFRLFMENQRRRYERDLKISRSYQGGY